MKTRDELSNDPRTKGRPRGAPDTNAPVKNPRVVKTKGRTGHKRLVSALEAKGKKKKS